MIKKFLMSCLFLALVPFSAFAISLDEIQSNPSKYVLVYKTSCCAAFVDVDSIHMLRQDPPHISLKTEFYTVIYDSKVILKDNRTFIFDTNRAAALLLKEVKKDHPEYTDLECAKIVISLQKKDSGIYANHPHWEVFNFGGDSYPEVNGALAYLLNKSEWRDVLYGDTLTDVSNFVFNKWTNIKNAFFSIPGPYAAYI